MAFISVLRIVVLCTSIVFAVIALGLSAHLTSLIKALDGQTVPFTALALATACLTILTLPIMLVMEFVREGSFTSMVSVELIWIGILWIMWLALGADGVDSARPVFPHGCVELFFEELDLICHESMSIVAFSFLNFILLFGYSATLLVFAIIGAGRGQTVWTSSVKRANFLAPVNTKTNTTMSSRSYKDIPMQQQQASRGAGHVGSSQLRQGNHPISAEV